jgi:predicted Zn finger-like uncharacterized protein
MTLATTCPRCKTSFRVVADQLKLRRGMVRCGVCQNVFNGLEHLRYVEALSGGQASESIGDPAILGQPRPEPVKINVPPIKISSPPVNPLAAAPVPINPTAPLPTTAAFAPSLSATSFGLASGVQAAGQQVSPLPIGFTQDLAPTFAPTFAPTPAPTQPAAEFFNQEQPIATTQPPIQFSDFNVPKTIPASLTPSAEKANQNNSPYSPISDADLDDIYPSNRNPNTEFLNERGLGESTTLTRSDDDVHTAFFLPESVPAELQGEVIQPPRSIQTSYVGSTNGAVVANAKNESTSNVEEDAVDFFSSEESYGTTHDRASNWIRRGLIGLLVISLLVQSLLLARNWLSIRLPSVQPSLDGLSGLFGMKVEVPRNLSMLTIESFDVQSTARPDILSVSAIVRNRSAYSVQWPAMELTLTGVDGRPVLRKVLLPREYLNQAPTERGVPGGSEHPIRIGLQTEPIEAKGFSVNIFYP